MNYVIRAAQDDLPSYGNLQINVTSILGSRPISGAMVQISYGGEPTNVIEEITTDANGQTESIELPAPPVEYSMDPTANQPYSEYNIKVVAPGFEGIEISGAELLPGQKAIQNVSLLPMDDGLGEGSELYVIPPHTLYGEYPPKIAESEVKSTTETGEIVLSRVVIPEIVVVHDGPPRDSSAKNYYVKYKDYIKNVASSEIYATWPEATIMANVLAIMSITLNRVYTEWYIRIR